MKILSFFFLFLLFLSVRVSAQNLVFARNEKLAEQEVAEIILTNLYKNIGIDIRVEPLPPARAHTQTVYGVYAGEVARIYSYGTEYPQFIRVETPYYYLTTVAFFRKNTKITVKDRDDLKKYRIGIINGVKHSEDITKGIPNVFVGASSKNLFLMLEANRIDIVIDTGINGKQVIKELNFENVDEVTLKKLDLYHYLNERHVENSKTINIEIKKKIKDHSLLKEIESAENLFFKK